MVKLYPVRHVVWALIPELNFGSQVVALHWLREKLVPRGVLRGEGQLWKVGPSELWGGRVLQSFLFQLFICLSLLQWPGCVFALLACTFCGFFSSSVGPPLAREGRLEVGRPPSKRLLTSIVASVLLLATSLRLAVILALIVNCALSYL